MKDNLCGCCTSGNDCCDADQKKKRVVIDFLYLDLSVCERCQGTESHLEQAIAEVSGVLKTAGFELTVNKINITSKELAVKHRFLSSPTIRINGVDLELTVKESACRECGDLCGDNVDCRVWVYEGVEYSEPPKAMIIDAILKAVYGKQNSNSLSKSDNYKLPDNLERFFAGRARKVD